MAQDDLPSFLLMQQEHANSKSGQELEVMGKHAAQLFVDGKCDTLSNAVIETVKTAGLSPEQVRRVVEFANTDAYLTEFNKVGGVHKYIEFSGGPADPGTVLREMNSGGGSTVFDRGTSDYSLEPPQHKTAELMDRNIGVVRDALGVFHDLRRLRR